MKYLTLTQTNGGRRVLIPIDSIVFVQESAQIATVYVGLSTVHVNESYEDIVQMIDSATEGD